MEIISPEDFKETMKLIEHKYEDDWEMKHIYMDALLCETLKGLGYGEGVEIFNNTGMWHA